MYYSFEHLLPSDFQLNSKVWIYQSNRAFGMGEALKLEKMLEEFTESWQSHGNKFKSYANLLFGQFIILMADESKLKVSGCSIDSSIQLIKSIESMFKVELFNRQNLAFIIKGQIQLLPLQQLNYAFNNNFIDHDTIYFNNLVTTKQALLNEWMIPVKISWIAKRFLKLDTIIG